MSETYTVSAKTVDEAIDLASKLYGGKNKEISHEIVSLPKKGFLGFGSKDAVIRVTVNEAEDDDLSSIVNELKKYKDQPAPESGYSAPEAKADAKAEAKADHKPQQKNEQKKPQQKNEQKKPQQKPEKPIEKPQQKVEKAQPKAEKPQTKAQQPAEKTDSKPQQKNEQKKPQQKPEKPIEKAQSKAEKPIEKAQSKAEKPIEKAQTKEANAPVSDVKIKVAVSREEMDFAIAFVNTMIGNMHLSAQAIPVSAPEGEEYTVSENADVYPAINIIGDDTGILIGHHGETLDAIQYLVNLALFRRSSTEKGRESIKITVDIENYREKREETLRALARRMAARAVKYKRNVFLEPMNPYERRIIHSELQDYADVATHSVGSDTNRKIIITYEGKDKAPSGNNKRRGRSGKGRHARQETAAPAESDVPQGLPLPTLDDVE